MREKEKSPVKALLRKVITTRSCCDFYWIKLSPYKIGAFVRFGYFENIGTFRRNLSSNGLPLVSKSILAFKIIQCTQFLSSSLLVMFLMLKFSGNIAAC